MISLFTGGVKSEPSEPEEDFLNTHLSHSASEWEMKKRKQKFTNVLYIWRCVTMKTPNNDAISCAWFAHDFCCVGFTTHERKMSENKNFDILINITGGLLGWSLTMVFLVQVTSWQRVTLSQHWLSCFNSNLLGNFRWQPTYVLTLLDI